VGVPQDKISLLFEKFSQADASTTREFGGTGLGLAICRELASLMGGVIGCESSEGKGAAFTVVLPLHRLRDPEAAPVQAAAEPSAEAFGTLRVLAAEDNQTNQRVLKAMLEPAGVELHMVGNGAEAVEAWQSGAFDLVLMDIQMPVMDGVTAMRMIREHEAISGRRRTPIVALTANAMKHQVAEYLAAGADGHVAKPIEAEALYAALDEAVATAAANMAA
jgi:CheY-like chemotaxis protein